MKLLMGNEAMAIGAIHAGVEVVTGYPGTPSSEVLEYIAQHTDENTYVEWSVNEKAAVEVAIGASFGGKRTLVTMKQVGLNAACDPVMNLSYLGTQAGMVILVADDPGPISSQTEQDTRVFGIYSKIPVLDPSSPEEAYRLMVEAFRLSEKYRTPVILRPTTRICHGVEAFELDESFDKKDFEPFQKDPKYVIFPKLSYQNHLKLEQRNRILQREFSVHRSNTARGKGIKGILSHGANDGYTQEILSAIDDHTYRYLKIATAYPFPTDLVKEFVTQCEEVLIVEELSAYLENNVYQLLGEYGIRCSVRGKATGDIPQAGELSVELLEPIIRKFLDLSYEEPSKRNIYEELLVNRPPVLCAGCPHRAAFYAVKRAMKGRRAVFTGDIGCYTLGNQKPLDMVDTCICMGAGVTAAQGLKRSEEGLLNFAFIGDSTFFHSGITGMINAVYNETDIILVVLDNRTTAMTGKQPHPGTGETMMHSKHAKIDIQKLLESIGVRVAVENPFDLSSSIETVKRVAEEKGVRAILFEAPCIKLYRPTEVYAVETEKCTGCKKCVREIGCPAFVKDGKYIAIDPNLCYGCGICESLCPTRSIGKRGGR